MTSVPLETDRPSFLARKTFGQPNYFLLALLAAFVVALMPRGARKAIDSNINKAEDWLPQSYAESIDLRWFRDHFLGEQFALVSWDGCTLGNTEKLEQLQRRLVPSKEALANADLNSQLHVRSQWYKRVITGPEVLTQLTSPPLSLTYGDAITRIERALVGPIPRDAKGNSLGNDARTTCLVVYLSPEATRDNRTMRRAVENIVSIAANECAISPESIHMGGPTVDNIAIDVEGGRTLVRLASLAGLTGLALCYWCFRSAKVSVIVMAIGVLSAGMSLAIVYYFGIFEVLRFGVDSPRLGTIDAILMSMPAVVYVLGLSSAIHLVHYYQVARSEGGLYGAAERAVRKGWLPCTLAACATALALGSLVTSDILPIKKFGLFTSISILATAGLLFTILPAFFHRFPLSESSLGYRTGFRQQGGMMDWMQGVFAFVVGRYVTTCLFWLVVTGFLALGLTHTGASVQLLKLLDEDTDLIHDYAWLEKNIGYLVPMEVVLTIPPERCRTADGHAEQDGQQYRMTMLERLDLMREIESRIEELPEVSRVMSVATFTPQSTRTGYGSADRSADYAKNKNLEEHRALLLAGDYLRMEEGGTSGRELWRLSARVAALGNHVDGTSGVDYGLFVEELKQAVDPILVAYQQRDMIVRHLQKSGKKLDGAQLCILYRTAHGDPEPTPATQESILANLVLKSGVQPTTLPDGRIQPGVTFYNLTEFDSHRGEPHYFERAIQALGDQDALILASAGSDPTARQFADGGLTLIDVTDVPVVDSSAAFELALDDTPRPVRSVFTGVVPLVYKAQRQLISFNDSMLWSAVMITIAMSLLLHSAMAGILSMLVTLFPIVVVLGTMGWLGAKVDIGIMMSACVALAMAIDYTVHFLTWFRRGIERGFDRLQAVLLAYDRCAEAMIQTTLIGGLGLAVFSMSTFTPTQQFGYLMFVMLSTALMGVLLLLPAMLVSPLGAYFGGSAPIFEDLLALELRGAFDLATTHMNELMQNPGKVIQRSAPPAPHVVPTSIPSTVAVSNLPKLRSEPEAPRTQTETPQRVNVAEEDQKALVDGPHAALHARLRNLRRESHGPQSS